jgi:putative flippase GtrA
VTALASRWLKFNLVGAVGIGVQLGVLWALRSGLRLHYLLATALAVEAAILHNFAWHERFTWKDRSGGSIKAVAGRFVRFHAGNGVISIVGNLAIMRLLVGVLGLRYLFANGIAIVACSLLNFAAAEWFVFRNPKR